MSDFELLNFIVVAASEGGADAFNWGFVIKHALNLGILIAVLVYFIRTPIKNFLESRRANLSREIEEANRAISEAKEKYEEYLQKLKDIEGEINTLKNLISDQSEAEKQEILEHAKNTCELLKRDAKETIELEALKAKKDIQEEIASSSIQIAKNLIEEKLNESDVSNSVDHFINEVNDKKWLQ